MSKTTATPLTTTRHVPHGRYLFVRRLSTVSNLYSFVTLRQCLSLFVRMPSRNSARRIAAILCLNISRTPAALTPYGHTNRSIPFDRRLVVTFGNKWQSSRGSVTNKFMISSTCKTSAEKNRLILSITNTTMEDETEVYNMWRVRKTILKVNNRYYKLRFAVDEL